MRYRGIEYKYTIIEKDGQFFGVCSFFIFTSELLYVEKKYVPEKSATKKHAKKIARLFSKSFIELCSNLYKEHDS